MNNKEFRTHFINACEQLKIEDYCNKTFKVVPVLEEGKKYNSIDDMMRLCFLPKNRKCDFEQVIKLFTWREGWYPLWIKISSKEDSIVLETSLRMRKAEDRDDKLFYPFIIQESIFEFQEEEC